eukprot:TRINITY_DN2553_c0_g1_i2.p1 TRINITY_DN2553_c0_g1~~TRINITY_DN2553_c0_g1_i2.p1  ORF type:complete len:325 (-),score=84.40 TRINITY_DN2553_c0_g1_i2:25-999(-)
MEAYIWIIIIVSFVLVFFFKGIYLIAQKEVVIVERLGKFHAILEPGINFIIPFIDKPKTFWHRFTKVEHGRIVVDEQKNLYRISTQAQVLDFPDQTVISRDNAVVRLDAILNYIVVDPKKMIYNSVNLPLMISKLLQTQLRNIAGSMDVDQIIQDYQSINVVQGTMNSECSRWGISVKFVKIQHVNPHGDIIESLERKKNADLENEKIIIDAKGKSQTMVLKAQGSHDKIIAEAEGHKQEQVANAKGRATAIENNSQAEARSISEIAQSMGEVGEHPAKYILKKNYVDAVGEILRNKNTEVVVVPPKLGETSAFIPILTAGKSQ